MSKTRGRCSFSHHVTERVFSLNFGKDDPVTEIFAHRGLHTTEPENSVASFLAAKAAGVHGVELDVRRTKDGALVVFHDGGIEGRGDINTLLLHELPEGLPTLEEAMTACQGLRVNVEIKNHETDPGHDPSGALTAQVMDLLKELGWLEHVIISSFDRATCELARTLQPNVPAGWLLDWRVPLGDTVKIAHDLGLSAIHPHYLTISASDVEEAHALGLAVNVWTVNAPDDVRAMLAMGVDTIITDDPVTALDILAASTR